MFRKGGFHSETVNTFNIGRLTTKQWFGEESILLGKESYIFSVVAATQVTVYEIQKHDVPKLFSEVKQALLQNSKSKLQWMEQRKNELTNTFTTIFFLNEEKKPEQVVEAITAQTEEIHSIVDNFPQATTYTLEKIQARRALREHLKSADMTKRKQPESVVSLSPNASIGKIESGLALPSRPRTAVIAHSQRQSVNLFKPTSAKTEPYSVQTEKVLSLASPVASEKNFVRIPFSSLKQKPDLDFVGEESSPEASPVAKDGQESRKGKRSNKRYLSIFKRANSSKAFRKLRMSAENTPISQGSTPKFDFGLTPVSKVRSPREDKRTLTFSSVEAIIEKIGTPHNKDHPLQLRTEESQVPIPTDPNHPQTVREGPGQKKKLRVFPSADLRASTKSSAVLSLKPAENFRPQMPFPIASPKTSALVRPQTAKAKPSSIQLQSPRVIIQKKESSREEHVNVYKLLGIKDHRKFEISSIVKFNSFRGYLPSKVLKLYFNI